MLDDESGYSSPNFIAFRIMEPDGQLLTVVAALDSNRLAAFLGRRGITNRPQLASSSEFLANTARW